MYLQNRSSTAPCHAASDSIAAATFEWVTSAVESDAYSSRRRVRPKLNLVDRRGSMGMGSPSVLAASHGQWDSEWTMLYRVCYYTQCGCVDLSGGSWVHTAPVRLIWDPTGNSSGIWNFGVEATKKHEIQKKLYQGTVATEVGILGLLWQKQGHLWI